MKNGLYVQYGSGPRAVDGWVNFDASPTLRIQKFPFSKILLRKRAIFDDDIKYGNIIEGLPIPDNSVRGLYCSHVLEHIHRNDVQLALANSFRVLLPGGIFRLVVPDLFWRVKNYLDNVGSGEATDLLQKRLHFRPEQAPKDLEARLRASLGLSMHQWMYDEALMTDLLFRAGFTRIRRCEFGDCEDNAFSKVEEESRFIYNGFKELAIECRKP
jgi:SAM-dependent methyltransferase